MVPSRGRLHQLGHGGNRGRQRPPSGPRRRIRGGGLQGRLGGGGNRLPPRQGDHRRQRRRANNQGAPKGRVHTRRLGGGAAKLTDMAKMTTAVATAAVEIRVDEEDVRQQPVLAHQPNEMRETTPLSHLEGEVKDTITSTRESAVLTASEVDNTPKRTQMGRHRLDGQLHWAHRDPYLLD